MVVFKAKIEDVDFPNSLLKEEYFDSFIKAEQFLIAQCSKLKVKAPSWKTSGDSTYFNAQTADACYHGCIDKILVK